MRIGLFSDTYPPFINGVSTSVQMLKRSLESLGHEVYVITINNEGKKYGYEENNTVIKIPGFKTGIYDYRLTSPYPRKAKKIIDDLNLDIYHSHTEFSMGIFARVLSKKNGVPLVHTYHTLYEDYMHYVTKGYFTRASKKIAKYFSVFFCDDMADELIVPTKKISVLFKKKYKVDKDIYVIPTGIEIERFYKENINIKKVKELKEKYKIKNDDFCILFVGRLAKEKNIDLLLEAQKEIKNKNIKLIIVGDGPDVLEYQSKAVELKIDDNVIFTGKVPWDEIPSYYHLGDLFATASTSETQGLTVIEAMAASVPPICIYDESFTNMVTDGVDGRFFKNEEEYIKIIEDLYNDRKELLKLQKGARRTSSVFSSKYYGESVIEVYEEAIRNHKYNEYRIINSFKKKIVGRKRQNVNSWKSKGISKKGKN